MKRRDFLKLTPDERRQYFRDNVAGKVLQRSFTITREVDEDNRTVSLSFSSDEPYDRSWYTEILSHDKKAIKLDRLNDGGALLSDHDWKRQIGVVVPGTAKSDGHVARCDVKFSTRQSAEDEYQDVKAGIRTKVSVGYVIETYEYDEKTDTLTATKWEPLEISLVAIPADTTVGVGRSLETEESGVRSQESEDDPAPGSRAPAPASSTSQKNQTHPAQTARVNGQRAQTRAAQLTSTRNTMRRRKKSTAPAEDEITCIDGDEDCGNERCAIHYEDEPAAERTAPVSREAQRAQQFVELGRIYGEEALALDYAADDTRTLDDLKKQILANRKARAKNTTPDPEHPEAAATRNGGGNLARVSSRVRLKNLKTHEEAHAIGRFLGGVMGLPDSKRWCKENGISLARAQSEHDNESGGIWVPEEWSDTLVVLREENSIVRQFCDVETMTSRTKNVRRQRKGLTAYPSGAKGTTRKVAQSEMEWDFFELIARKWKVTTKFEDELTDDAMIGFADKFAGESAYAFGTAEEDAFFNAVVSRSAVGVVGLKTKLRKVHATIGNIKGLTVASGNLFSEFVMGDFTKLVASLPEYADTKNTAWYMSRYFFWNVVVPLMLAAGGNTIREIEDAPIKKFLSYPVRISQKLPRADANSQIACYLGDLTLSSTFGDRLGQQVRQTDTNDDDWDNDLISMKAIERFDINHHDVGDTSEAGPVVGLISASS